MRGFFRLLARAAIAVSLLLLVLGGAGYWLYRDVTAPGPLTEPRAVVIPARTGLSDIASLLTEQGIIRHPRSFELGAIASGHSSALRAGRNEPASGDGNYRQRQNGQAPPNDPGRADERRDFGVGAFSLGNGGRPRPAA